MYEVKDDLLPYKLMAFLKRSERSINAMAAPLTTDLFGTAKAVRRVSYVDVDGLNQNIPYIELAIHELFVSALVGTPDANAVAILDFIREQMNTAAKIVLPVKIDKLVDGYSIYLEDPRLTVAPQAALFKYSGSQILKLSTSDFVMDIPLPNDLVVGVDAVVLIAPVLDANKVITGFEYIAMPEPTPPPSPTKAK